jgi:molybdate transport system ATP-binding protein
MLVSVSLDFVLRQGEFLLDVHQHLEAQVVALFGPSGAGKTTMLEALAGLRDPTSGTIEVGGRVFYSSGSRVNLPARRRRIGYVPQEAVLFPHMSVKRNVLYGAGRGNGIALERILEILEIEPLIERGVRSLSGGERQRVALARALMSSPRLLLLDEPLAALDLPLKRRIVPCLRRIRDDLGVPMIYVSHDATEVKSIADQVILLDRGVVAAYGPPGVVLP